VRNPSDPGSSFWASRVSRYRVTRSEQRFTARLGVIVGARESSALFTSASHQVPRRRGLDLQQPTATIDREDSKYKLQLFFRRILFSPRLICKRTSRARRLAVTMTRAPFWTRLSGYEARSLSGFFVAREHLLPISISQAALCWNDNLPQVTISGQFLSHSAFHH
jgi:hypothetical protein